MIHGFLNNEIVSAEEYLVNLELRKGQPVGISHNLIDMYIRFDNKEVDAFILDVVDDKLILQLVLPIKENFDNKSNVYKTSYIRKLLNSDNFLSRFNQEFVNHIKPTEVHTEDYTITDKLWLLGHEEVCQYVNFLRTNNNCRPFDLFKHINLRSYSQALLKLNKQRCFAWRLRSATSYTNYEYYSRFVGYVDYNGIVNYYYATYTDYGALLPACTIG